MINYIKHNNIDKVKWDKTISDSVNGNVYANSWYLDIIHPGWNALIEDDYTSVMPLTTGEKYGITYLYQPFFVQQLGVFSVDLLYETKIQNFVAAIPRSIKFSEYNLNIFNKANLKKELLIEKQNFELDLITTYESIYKNYSSNLKRNLKKANKAELKVVHNIRPDEIITLFRENKGQYVKSWDDQDYARLNQVVYKGIYKGSAKTSGVYNERNELIAGMFLFHSHKKVIFLFSATNEEAKQVGAMPFLINSFIKENAEKHMTFDFEGSNDEALARFYKGFGAKRIVYYQLKFNKLSIPTKLIMSLVKFLRGIFK